MKQEIEELKAEVLATHKKEIDQYRQENEPIEYVLSEKWPTGFWDTIILIPFRAFKNWMFSVVRRTSKPGIIYVVLISAIAYETVHFYDPTENIRPKIIQEYSNVSDWTQQAAKNANTDLIYGFVKIQKAPPPHIPEAEFQREPNVTYAQLSGFSPYVSGQAHQWKVL